MRITYDAERDLAEMRFSEDRQSYDEGCTKLVLVNDGTPEPTIDVQLGFDGNRLLWMSVRPASVALPADLVTSAERSSPDDPNFEGAQFISREAMIQHKIANASDLHGIAWVWATWSPHGDDHDHCLICHDAAFSDAYDGDLREGWRSTEPSWESPGWLCQTCFDRFREHFGWRVGA